MISRAARRLLSQEQAVVEATDAAAAGALAPPLPGSADPQVQQMDRRVPDPDVNAGAVRACVARVGLAPKSDRKMM